jgi:hypothetical protein
VGRAEATPLRKTELNEVLQVLARAVSRLPAFARGNAELMVREILSAPERVTPATLARALPADQTPDEVEQLLTLLRSDEELQHYLIEVSDKNRESNAP